MPIYQRARQHTRQVIMDAAVACLLRGGYEHLTITAVADEADVGRGTFYRYFDDVNDTLLAIIEQYFVGLHIHVQEMMGRYESPEKEIRAWQAAFEHAVQLKPLFEAMNHSGAIQLAERLQAVMIQGFAQSLATNAFAYPQWMNLPNDIMATFTAGAVLAVLRKWLAGDLPYNAAQMAQMVYKLLYHRPADS